MEKNRAKSLPLSQVKIKDSYWNRYVQLVREDIIPYQWDILNDNVVGAELSHCIKNFEIAAGKREGEYGGAVFQDTDVAKWLEAVAYTLEVYPDDNLEKLADEVINLIGAAQGEDGYLNTYFTIKEPKLRWTNLKEGHELYTAGHMIEAAVAYYQATGKDTFLNIMRRFADLICETFGGDAGQCHGYPGHQEIELALVKLYQVTNEEKYLQTAKFFIDARGVGENYFLEEAKGAKYKKIFPEFAAYDTKYSQSHLPVREQTTAEGHAVRAVYMYMAMADLAWYFKDDNLFKACETLWNNMVEKRLYLTGSIGSSGLLERFTVDYDLPNDCNYSETCASIGLALFGKRMAEISKDAKYIDIVERALYNTVLSGIALDGKSFFYVNPLEVWPSNCMERTSKEHVKAVRQKWFGVACCPPNIARTLASLGQYIYFSDEERAYINLYISNEATVNIGTTVASIKLDSDILNTGEVSCVIEDVKGASEIEMALRIPQYAKSFVVTINNVAVTYKLAKGYALINVKAGDEIKIVCEIPPIFVRANPKVRADVGHVAILKGPEAYCLEEVDNGDNLSAIFVDTNQKLEFKYEVETLGGIGTILLKGQKVKENWNTAKLYSEQAVAFESIDLKAVPYGSWGNRASGEMSVWIKELL